MEKYIGIKFVSINRFKMINKIVIAFLLIFTVMLGLNPINANAQSIDENELNDAIENNENVLQTEVIDGDTLPLVLLAPVAVVATKKRDYVSEYKFKRLTKHVTKVYPYAKEAARIIDEIDAVTSDIDKKRKQKKYIKQLEKDLKKNFEGELRKLTISQGKVLTKLVSRETGLSTHELIKEYKSGITATFWQTIGKKFGYDLKHHYDPINDVQDKDIEQIVLSLEENGF